MGIIRELLYELYYATALLKKALAALQGRASSVGTQALIMPSVGAWHGMQGRGAGRHTLISATRRFALGYALHFIDGLAA